MKKLVLLLPLLSIFLFQCSVEKRKYQKGYHVAWKSSHQPSKIQKTALTAKKPDLKPIENPQEIVIQSISSDKSGLTASIERKTTVGDIKFNKTPLIGDEPCDEIIFRDGSEMKAKVTEITETEVKYKKCDVLEGPTYVAKKSDLFMIKYANGTREVFKTENSTTTRPVEGEKNYRKKTQPFAVASLVLGILSIVIYIAPVTATLAIIFGNAAKRRIAAQPDLYKGEGIATAGKILGIVWLSVLILLIILAFVALALFI